MNKRTIAGFSTCMILALGAIGFLFWRASVLDRMEIDVYRGALVIGTTTDGDEIVQLGSGRLALRKR